MTIRKLRKFGAFFSLALASSTIVALSACNPDETDSTDDDDDSTSDDDDDDDGDDDDDSTGDDDDDDASDDDDDDNSSDDDDDDDDSTGDDDDDDASDDDDDDNSSDDDDDDDDDSTSGDDDDDDSTTGDDDDDDAGCGEGTTLESVTFGEIPTWKNNAKGAYTIFHDDTCWDHESSHFKIAAPELEKRGLIAAFGMVAAGCDGWEETSEGSGDWQKANWDQWAEVKKLSDFGHELVNHSFAHITVQDGAYKQEQEIDQANELMRKAVLPVPIDFYIFPQDLSGDGQISRLQELDYLGARTGQKGGMNQPDSLDAFHLNYDVHASPTGVGANEHQLVELDDYVDQAISGGGYAIREFHAVVDSLPSGDSTWMITTSEYTAHLDHVEEKVKAGELWITGPAMVIRYLKARDVCPMPTYSDGKVTFGDISDECKRNSEFVSYEVEATGDFTAIGGEQNGICVQSVENGGKIYLNLNPALGDATIWGVK